jgi:hypothetical protein
MGAVKACPPSSAVHAFVPARPRRLAAITWTRCLPREASLDEAGGEAVHRLLGVGWLQEDITLTGFDP